MKENAILWLAYYDVAVQHISYYGMGTPPVIICMRTTSSLAMKYIYISMYGCANVHAGYDHVVIYTLFPLNIYLFKDNIIHTYIHIYVYIYVFIYIYIYTWIYLLKSEYLGSKLLLRQVLLKMMEHCFLFLIVIFHISFLFFLCWDPGGKGIVPYLLPDCFQSYFWSSSGIV